MFSALTPFTCFVLKTETTKNIAFFELRAMGGLISFHCIMFLYCVNVQLSFVGLLYNATKRNQMLHMKQSYHSKGWLSPYQRTTSWTSKLVYPSRNWDWTNTSTLAVLPVAQQIHKIEGMATKPTMKNMHAWVAGYVTLRITSWIYCRFHGHTFIFVVAYWTHCS